MFTIRQSARSIKIHRNFQNRVQFYGRNNDENSRSAEVRDVHVDKTPVTSLLWNQRNKFQVLSDENTLGTSNEKPILLDKKSIDSRISVTYDFATDFKLRDQYINSSGNVLMGKIFQDLDALAGSIVHKHCYSNDSYFNNLHFVTASVDKIIKKKLIPATQNIILCGQIAYVGKSSLDVIIELHNANIVKTYSDSNIPELFHTINGNLSRLLSCYFTFVAKNKDTNLPSSAIHRFHPSTSYEENLYKQRELLAKQRKKDRNQSNSFHSFLNIEQPEQYQLINTLIDRGNALKDMPALAHMNSVLISQTGLENSLLIPPQNVNTSGRVFGGFLMHRAYDLALSTCYSFSGMKPFFREVDKITFKRPVDIGDLVRFKSRVVYASDNPILPIVQVEVTCQVMRPEQSCSYQSNTFNFIFGFPEGVSLRHVLPTTLEEAITLITASKTSFN